MMRIAMISPGSWASRFRRPRNRSGGPRGKPRTCPRCGSGWHRMLPRYPIYIPSKGRADACLTARFMVEDGLPFHLAIEEQEQAEYASRFGRERLLILPARNQGVVFARNWIKQHAMAAG